METVLLPVPADVFAALLARRTGDEGIADVLRRLSRPLSLTPAPKARTAPKAWRATGKISYRLLGETRCAATAIAAVIDVLGTLGELCPQFFDQLARLTPCRTRNHLASRAADVYPGRPDLARDYVTEIAPGWYLGTNIANREKRRILVAACSVAGIAYGADLVIDLPEQ